MFDIANDQGQLVTAQFENPTPPPPPVPPGYQQWYEPSPSTFREGEGKTNGSFFEGEIWRKKTGTTTIHRDPITLSDDWGV